MDPDRAELQRRQQLALSMLGHREPTARLLEMVQLALLGATIEDLMAMDRAA